MSGKRLFLASTILASLSAVPATAQSVPVLPTRELIDGNGVDLFRGTFTYEQTIASVGGEQGMAYRVISRGSVATNNIDAFLSISGNTYYVTAMGRTDRFTKSGSTYIPTEANGASLTVSSNIYTYTARDGTLITFSPTTDFNAYGVQWLATSTESPSGQRLDYVYDRKHFCEYYEGDFCTGGWSWATRLTGVTSAYGYMLKIFHVSDDLEDGSYLTNWFAISDQRLVNRAVDHCAPGIGGCTLTQNWPGPGNPNHPVNSYVGSGGVITGVRRPGSISNDLTIAYANGKVSSVADHSGTTSYAYADASGSRTVTVTNALNQVSLYTFLITSERLTSYRDPLNNTTGYSYDGSGRLTRITRPEGNYTEFTYDARGNVTQTRHVAKAGSGTPDIVTSAAYPSTCSNVATCNQPTSTTDARGNVTDYTYNSTHGGVLTVTAPAPTAGAVRPRQTFTYTSQQAQIKSSTGTFVGTGTNITLPQSVSQCATQASCAGTADEIQSTVSYGGVGYGHNLQPHIVSSGSGDGALTATTSLGYDGIGNLTALDGPLPGPADTTTAIYDDKRRVVGIISPDPDGGGPLPRLATRNTFNAKGELTTSETGTVPDATPSGWNAFSQAQRRGFFYDANGRVIRENLFANGADHALIDYLYDPVGRRTCAIQHMDPAQWGPLPGSCAPLQTNGPNGPDRVAQTLYDVNGRPTQQRVAVGTAAQANERTLAYNPNGTLALLVDGNNNRTTYHYDGHDRLTTTQFPVPTTGANASSTTDYEQQTLDAASNVISRRLRNGQSIGYGYDALGRLITKDLPGSEPDVSYSHDLAGRMVGATFTATGQGVTFTYDALGRATSTTSTMDGVGRTLAYDYDLAGNRTRLTHPDGVFFTMGHDGLGRMTGASWTRAGSTTPFLAISYDALGRRSDVNRGASFTGTGYDAVSRLASINQRFAGGAGNVTTNLTYNPASQIRSAARDNDSYAWTGAVAGSRNYGVNGLNQYSSAGALTFDHDPKGNLTRSGTDTYGYDSENRLTSASLGGQTVSVRYDPLGRLHEVAGSVTGTTRFLYDGIDLVAEYGTHGGMFRRYAHGPGVDEPVLYDEGSAMDCSGTRFLHADERGSIVALADCWGNRRAINTYDEYGVPASDQPGQYIAGRFAYTGQAWLPELGMYHYKARLYSPTLGRFMQTDPIGFEGDGPNLYAYVLNDPVNWVDPLGLKRCGPNEVAGIMPGTGGVRPVFDDEGRHVGSVVTGGVVICHRVPHSEGPRGMISGGFHGGAVRQAKPQSDESKPSASDCLIFAGKKNGVNLALDAGGAVLVLASAKFQVAAAVGGSVLGLIGIGTSIANQDATGAGLAFAGKQSANAGGIAKAGSALARGASRFGAAAVAASTARDLAQAYEDYQQCRAGTGQ